MSAIQSTAPAAEKLRFGFGRNWAKFLRQLSPERIAAAERSLLSMLEKESLSGVRFLDIGSGSGLFSLAARRLGAEVRSFDYDRDSVGCTSMLKEKYFANDTQWQVEQGSALDEEYIRSLGQFDVVYSWGVLHHTGDMWKGLANAALPVRPGGKLFISIYNDQRWVSAYWTIVKKLYNRNPLFKWLMIAMHLPYPFAAALLYRALTGRLKLDRGMAPWTDLLDWLGGYPFQVARPEEIFAFYKKRNFDLLQLRTCGGRLGCNEYVFRLG